MPEALVDQPWTTLLTSVPMPSIVMSHHVAGCKREHRVGHDAGAGQQKRRRRGNVLSRPR